jgi:hypothetical protein
MKCVCFVPEGAWQVHTLYLRNAHANPLVREEMPSNLNATSYSTLHFLSFIDDLCRIVTLMSRLL